MVYIKDIFKEQKRTLVLKVVPENPPACMPHPFSHVRLFATPWTIAPRLLCPWNFPDKWSGLPYPPPGDLSDPGIESVFPALQTDSLLLSH